MNSRFAAFLLVVQVWFVGCASFSTTPISRHDNNSISGDSNGLHRWICCKNRPYRGVPVKIKVRTHVDVWVKERYALTQVGGPKVNQWVEKTLGSAEQPLRLMWVEKKEVHGEQVVITDFKRPASGTIDLTVDFTDEQYFQKVQSDITDTTITDSTALLTTILSGTGIIKSSLESRNAPNDSSTIKWQERTVAYQRFDINAPDFEQQVEAFVNHHLNDCNSCGQNFSPAF